MNRTIEDSEPYIVCMSTRRGEKELEVISSGEKQVNYLDLEIKLEDGALMSNNLLKTEKGNIKFTENSFKQIKENKSNRKTRSVLNRENNRLEK